MAQQMDMANYMELMASEIYIGNGDWPYNNMRYWRKSVPYAHNSSYGHDGRWRWMYFDLDGAFGGTCADVNWFINNLKRGLADTGLFRPFTKLYINLMKHSDVRNEYINTSCDLLNSNFLPAVVLPQFTEIENRLNPEMLRHVERFRYPSNATTLADRVNEVPNLQQWNNLAAKFKQFCVNRPFYVRRHMLEEWNLADTSIVSIDVNDQQMGEVQVNSLRINVDLVGASTNVYPWNGMYFNGVPITLTAYAKPGYKFSHWLPSNNTAEILSVNLQGDSAITAVFVVDPDYVPLVALKINELQADNKSYLVDEYLEYDDWFEIYNPNGRAVDLNGYYVTDDPQDLTKYQLGPNEVMIDANGFLLLWADNQTGQGVLHTNFKLNKEGDYLALVEPDGQTIMHDITFGQQQTNYSYGSEVDGTQPWIEFQFPTPMYSNMLTSVKELQVGADFTIYPNPVSSEVVYFNVPITGEVYNTSGVALKKLSQTTQLNVSDLPAGIYFVRNALTAKTQSFIVR
jgi:hypothetical protein